MKKTIFRTVTFTFCSIPLLMHPSPAIADRQNTVTGSISVTQDYDSNIYRTDTGETEEWITTLAPAILFTSESARDSISFRYSPLFKYNHRTDKSSFKDSYLTLAAERSISKRVQLILHDSFEKTDDSTRGRDETKDTANRLNLSENRIRNEYWANYFDISSNWNYRENSFLSIGYNHAILDNKGPNEDFQRHAPRLSIDHEINRHWAISGAYLFTKGDFDSSDNTKQHDMNGRLSYHLTQNQTIYGQGNYLTTDNSGTKIDYHVSGGLLGYSQQINEKTAVDVAAGYSSAKADNRTNSDGFYYSLSLNRSLERGNFSLSGAGGFQDEQFNGEPLGLSKFWSLKSSLNYQLAEKITSALYALFDNNKYIESVPDLEDDSYEAGGSLTWSFSQYYLASLRYVFHKLDSNLANRDYEDHRIYVTLSAAKDIWKW